MSKKEDIKFRTNQTAYIQNIFLNEEELFSFLMVIINSDSFFIFIDVQVICKIGVFRWQKILFVNMFTKHTFIHLQNMQSIHVYKTLIHRNKFNAIQVLPFEVVSKLVHPSLVVDRHGLPAHVTMSEGLIQERSGQPTSVHGMVDALTWDRK